MLAKRGELVVRIEIINNSNAANSLSVLNENLSAMISQSETTLSSLQTIKQFSYSMNGGVGSLQNAVDFVSNRMEQEETTKNNLIAVRTKLEEFLTTVQTIDVEVSEKVTQNEEEFYRVTGWKKPAGVIDLDKWFENARKWLNDKVLDAANNVLNHVGIYYETDYSSMSKSELKKYAINLIDRKKNGEFDIDDQIRLNALYDYVSKESMNDIDLFIYISEQIYPEKMILIQEEIDNLKENYTDDQKKLIKYYMANGTSKYTSINLLKELSNKLNNVGDIYELSLFKAGEGFYQGNFWIGNFNVVETADGTYKIKAVARQSSVAKSEGAVIVHDEFGNIVDIQILNRYKNSTDFISSIQSIWKGWHGEDYEETSIDIEIPKGGYAQITDDPDVLDYFESNILDEKAKQSALDTDIIEDTSDLTSNDVKVIGTVDPSYVQYGDKVSTYTEKIELVANIVDKLEAKFWSDQQRGSGSCYIYNH